MKDNKLSLLGILGCLAFDAALIIAFYKAFGLFDTITTDKSIVMLLVLIIGLIIINGTIIFPTVLLTKLGIQYSGSATMFLILYAIIANVLSIYLIKGSITWYIIWELIILSVFIIAFSRVTAVSEVLAKDVIKIEKEQADKFSVAMHLLEIERLLKANENKDEFKSSIDLFMALKERIQSSTPFGRITGNNAVLEIEHQIKDNLVSLQSGFQEELTDKDRIVELQQLIEDTRRHVINRETLNIK